MSRSIECICINDANRPSEIPQDRWVKVSEKYHVTHIFLMMQQNKIQGCELAEFDISDCVPYNCYRLDRFAFTEENFKKLMEMVKDCDHLKMLIF
mgnify:FL=1